MSLLETVGGPEDLKRLSPGQLPVLAAEVRSSSVAVAPAHALTLVEVRYPPDDELAARAEATRRVRTASS